MSATPSHPASGLLRLAGRGALVGASLAVGVPLALEFLVVGALALPAVARGPLRHVPLGRVVLETSLGTAIGASVGLLLACSAAASWY